MIKRKNKHTSKKKLFLLPGILIGLLVLGGIGFYVYQQRNNDTEEPESIVADPNFSDGTDREPGTSVDRDGGVVNNPDDENEAPQGEPTISESGDISVYEPQQNQLLKSGDRLYGTSEFDTVWYRLIDDKIGVVAQGSLPVKNGKFSGTFSFTSEGSEGRLDIFRMTDDYQEADNIEINIKLR